MRKFYNLTFVLVQYTLKNQFIQTHKKVNYGYTFTIEVYFAHASLKVLYRRVGALT